MARSLSASCSLLLLFQSSALNAERNSEEIAQILMQSTPANLCSALAQRDCLAIPNAPTAILSAQVVLAADQTPEYGDVNGYVTPQVQFEVRLPVVWQWANGKVGKPSFAFFPSEVYCFSV